MLDSVTNDASRWCLGRPGTITITRFHSLAGGTPLTRSLTQSIDPALCRVTQRVDEPGNPDLRVTTDLGYDSFGNLVARTASASGQTARTRRFDWSSSGRFLAARTDEEGQRTTANWDPVQGLPMSVTDPNGLVTMWQYDSFRRLTRETGPDGTFTETTRGTCGTNCLAPTAVRFVTSSEQAFGGLPIRSFHRRLRHAGPRGLQAVRAARRLGHDGEPLLESRTAGPAQRPRPLLRYARLLDELLIRSSRTADSSRTSGQRRGSHALSLRDGSTPG